MSQSHSTASPEAVKTSSLSHPLIPVIQPSLDHGMGYALAFIQRSMDSVGYSPQTSPSSYGSLLNHLGSPSMQTGMLQRLQRSYGNGYVGQVVQAKLAVNQPGDVYEQEADKVAEKVMRMPEPRCPECGEEEKEQIQTKPLTGISKTEIGIFRVPTEEGIKKGDYEFSTHCGWIDWGHANPTKAKEVINKVKTTPLGSTFTVKMYTWAHSGWVTARILKTLTPTQEKRVALGVFQTLSKAFEEAQSDTDFLKKTGFAVEDLPSNLVGFYRAAEGYSVPDIKNFCWPWGEKSSLDRYKYDKERGFFDRSNPDFVPPEYFPSGRWPPELSTIRPEPPGTLWAVAGKLWRGPLMGIVHEIEGRLYVPPMIMRMPSPKCRHIQMIESSPQLLLQRQEIAEEDLDELVMAKGASSNMPQRDIEMSLIESRGIGCSLPEDTRLFMESRFGVSFEGVRIHTDSNAALMARDLNALAFTSQSDIYFGTGMYSPGTSEGKRLLAHELTHVVQQSHQNHRACVQRKEAKEMTYVVKPRDTVAKIAAAFGVTPEELMAKNVAKVTTWQGSQGKVAGFNAGETIIIPAGKKDMAEKAVEKPSEKHEEGAAAVITEALKTAWEFWKEVFASGEEKRPESKAKTEVKPAVSGLKDPKEVISRHNELGTFGTGVKVKVTSTKRDSKKQLDILKDYCEKNKTKLDEFAEKTEWLKGKLDWEKFKTCSLSDENIWLPFFMALYYGGGGPGVKSDKRSLPLVASPAQRVWKGKDGKERKANASPHIAGRAMDVKDGNLKELDTILREKIPEFEEKGSFPISSTQIENVSGQKLVHINFTKEVFG